MKTLELNTDKILAEMKRLGYRKGWLAARLNIRPAMVSYILKKKPVSYAVRLGKIFGIDAKDLIK